VYQPHDDDFGRMSLMLTYTIGQVQPRFFLQIPASSISAAIYAEKKAVFSTNPIIVGPSFRVLATNAFVLSC
jgi:hypothetical protein